MEKLLRSSALGMFVAEKDGWTQDIKAARSFQRTSEAIAFARELRLRDIELYTHFDGTAENRYYRRFENSIR